MSRYALVESVEPLPAHRTADRRADHPPLVHAITALQRQAGNGAVARLVRTVQRCGSTPADVCPCHQEQGDEAESGPAVQRAPDDTSAAAPGATFGPPTAARAACTTTLIGEDDWKLPGGAGDYYRSVAKELLATAEARGVEFDRGIFVVAQARAEQGTGDPKQNHYRVLNLTVTSDEQRGATAVPGEPGVFQTASGRKFQRLRTREMEPACSNLKLPVGPDGMCETTSPFYVYDSIGEQTRHYLDAATAGRPGVMDILTKKKGSPGETAGINDFSSALKGYGTDLNYAAKLCANYNAVVRDMGTILDNAIRTKDACLKTAWQDLADAWTVFNGAHKEHADAHAAGDQARITRAQAGIAQAEATVKQRGAEVKWLEDALTTLRARRAALAEATCPPMKKVPPPPPTSPP